MRDERAHHEQAKLSEWRVGVNGARSDELHSRCRGDVQAQLSTKNDHCGLVDSQKGCAGHSQVTLCGDMSAERTGLHENKCKAKCSVSDVGRRVYKPLERDSGRQGLKSRSEKAELAHLSPRRKGLRDEMGWNELFHRFRFTQDTRIGTHV